jgi:site-specific DNA-cytosine methylase
MPLHDIGAMWRAATRARFPTDRPRNRVRYKGRFVHPKERRTLTPRETARLQFIPDFFSFDEARGMTELADMIGNAVPSKLSYILAAELLR